MDKPSEAAMRAARSLFPGGDDILPTRLGSIESVARIIDREYAPLVQAVHSAIADLSIASIDLAHALAALEKLQSALSPSNNQQGTVRQ